MKTTTNSKNYLPEIDFDFSYYKTIKAYSNKIENLKGDIMIFKDIDKELLYDLIALYVDFMAVQILVHLKNDSVDVKEKVTSKCELIFDKINRESLFK